MSQGMEGKVPQSCQGKYLIVLILEGSGFYETARRVCNNHTTIPVLISHHYLIVSLDAFPVSTPI